MYSLIGKNMLVEIYEVFFRFDYIRIILKKVGLGIMQYIRGIIKLSQISGVISPEIEFVK